VTAIPRETSRWEVPAHPRWYTHGYNRAELYRLATLLGWLPRPVRLALARHIARLAPRLVPAERAAIEKTLRLVTGASGDRLHALAAGVFSDFAMCFSDLVSTNRDPVARRRSIGSITGPGRLADLGGGLVSLTAHVGNWELAGRLLAQGSARRTHVVVAEEEARELERWVRRGGDGLRFVPRSHPCVSVDLLAALRRGEVVAVQGDRALGTRGDVLVSFFGRPAPFPIGPFLLASAARVPIVPAFCLLAGDYRYTVRVEAPMAVTRGAEEDALRVWVSVLEGIVRDHPTQWFNFFDVWNPFGSGDSPAA
jgi:lauroyl/myristoyl acyltransferase